MQMVYACSKNLYPGVDNYLPFIHCVDDVLIKMFPKGLPEGTVNMTLANSVMTGCAKTVGHDYAKLDACATGPDGIKYIGAEMAKTPGHKGVPFWQIGDGAVTYPDQTNKEDLLKLVCAALTGTKPAACGNATVPAFTSVPTPGEIEKLVCEALAISEVVFEDWSSGKICVAISKIVKIPDCQALVEKLWDKIIAKCPKGLTSISQVDSSFDSISCEAQSPSTVVV